MEAGLEKRGLAVARPPNEWRVIALSLALPPATLAFVLSWFIVAIVGAPVSLWPIYVWLVVCVIVHVASLLLVVIRARQPLGAVLVSVGLGAQLCLLAPFAMDWAVSHRPCPKRCPAYVSAMEINHPAWTDRACLERIQRNCPNTRFGD